MIWLAAWVWLAAPGDAWAGPFRASLKAADRGDASRLIDGLSHAKGYVREISARGLAELEPSETGLQALISCAGAGDERGYVRSACAETLGLWRVPEAVPVLVDALPELDAETRYWFALTLHRIDTPDARAALAGLVDDPDLFVSTAAREWSR